MKARANVRIDILRGTVTDAYGDSVDDNTSAAASGSDRIGILASILEQGKRVYLPAEGAFRVVRAYFLRVGAEVDLRKDDRIRWDGDIWVITELSEPDGFALGGIAPDWVATISRTT